MILPEFTSPKLTSVLPYYISILMTSSLIVQRPDVVLSDKDEMHIILFAEISATRGWSLGVQSRHLLDRFHRNVTPHVFHFFREKRDNSGMRYRKNIKNISPCSSRRVLSVSDHKELMTSQKSRTIEGLRSGTKMVVARSFLHGRIGEYTQRIFK